MRRRRNVEFDSGSQAERCRAWLYLPDGIGLFPVIVMAHGLGAIKEVRLDAYAERFSEAGYACLATPSFNLTKFVVFSIKIPEHTQLHTRRWIDQHHEEENRLRRSERQ